MKANSINLVILTFLIIVAVNCSAQKHVDYLHESKEDFDKRMEWWHDAGFGMFIHWGLYAVPGGVYQGDIGHAEWIQETADIPVKEYEKYAEQFNPVKFNANEWVRMAKEAGMKYIVITSKHHDGFCLWDSKISDYDIINRTPFKRDILKELAEACKKEGIKFCFYHSIMDWHHPDAQGNYYPDYNDRKKLNPNFSNYVENYMKPQLKELLTGYGDLGVLWFDGEWIGDWTEEQGRSLYNYVRSFQPDIIINNRVGKGRRGMQGMNEYEEAAGDFGTPEQEILEGASTLDWESCMTMNDHWGYASYDTNFKSTETLIHNLIDIAAKGGNYLLNIGPTAEGLFPQESIDRLKEIGEWMKINSEVIHESGSLKNYKETETLYYVTGKEKKYIYAISTTWPGTSLGVKYVVPDEGTEIELLGFDEPLNWTIGSEEGVIIDIPEKLQEKTNRPCQYAWIFKIEGKPAKVNE
jgi:alpha-L-fucosidase